jgi:aminoglycoside phosphotransferase (APT) family kinase protein
LALGQPAPSFPWRWSVYRWLQGKTAHADRIENLTEFAISLAHFLTALQQIEATGGPPPGLHSAFRGGPLEFYAAEARQAIAALKDEIEVEAVTNVLEAALATPWRGTPVWFHGDVAVGNLLVQRGQLSAVIDFGCAGVGDPACDAVIAWTLFSGESREAFRAAWPMDAATWARGRGWALWKALITLAEYRFTDAVKAAEARHVIHQVITDETE